MKEHEKEMNSHEDGAPEMNEEEMEKAME